MNFFKTAKGNYINLDKVESIRVSKDEYKLYFDDLNHLKSGYCCLVKKQGNESLEEILDQRLDSDNHIGNDDDHIEQLKKDIMKDPEVKKTMKKLRRDVKIEEVKIKLKDLTDEDIFRKLMEIL